MRCRRARSLAVLSPTALLFAALALEACGGGGDSTPTQPGPSTPTPVLTSVTITTPAQTVTVGQTLQLSASPRDQNGAAIGATVTWTSSAPTIASVSGTGLVAALAVGSATITAQATAGTATVSSNTQITVSPPVAVLTSVAVSAPVNSITVGSTVQLTASPRDQNGAAIAATVTWSSSATGIATVSGTGLVAGAASGTATITASATAGGVTVSGTQQITVTAAVPTPVLTTVVVTPATATIIVGGGAQLTSSPRDQFGNAIAATVTWSSSAPNIATVNATGGVTAVAAGTATITASATAGGVTVTGTAQITVNNAAPVLTSVTIAGPTTVAVGAMITLTASPRDQFNNAIAATVGWSSLTMGIATVNSGTGAVAGVSAGMATIRATATAGAVSVTADRVITVTGGFPATADVQATVGNIFNPGSVDIAVGGTVNFIFNALHNVTFNPMGGAPSDIPNTASGTVSRTFATAGSFGYQCTLHGGMNGTVIVH